MQRSRVSIIVVAGAALFLIIAGIYYYFMKSYGPSGQEYTKAFGEGRKAYFSGEPSVAEFQNALNAAMTPAEEALAKVNLGVAYFATNRTEAVQVLKEVASNEAYPPFYRAGAINYILQNISATNDFDFAKRIVFTGTWATYLERNHKTDTVDSDSVYLAIRKAYEYSSSLFSTFPAEYWIADWYSSYALIDESLNSITKDFYIATAKERLAKGDSALVAAEANRGTADIVEEQIGESLSLRAQVLADLYFLNSGVNHQAVEDAYAKSVATFANDHANIQSLGSEFYARFYWAAFIAQLKDKSRNQEIMTILEPIYGADRQKFNVFSFFAGRASETSSYLKQQMVFLSAIDPRFKQLLSELGWQKQDFQ